jgi:hypothetical protein
MNSNSSSIVISFSIAILLLLILLLLISYNSKCKMDNIERFENEYSHPQKPINANLDIPNINAANGSMPLGNIYASDSSRTEYASPDGNNNNQNPLNNPNSIVNAFTNPIDTPAINTSSSNKKQETFIGENNTCFDRDRLTSSDLLPLDSANSKWAQINPAGSGMLGDQNFLTAGYHIGINTIGQSLRNANLQLRSEPPNPQVAVSPWGISTIEPDIRTTTLEIGSAASY